MLTTGDLQQQQQQQLRTDGFLQLGQMESDVEKVPTQAPSSSCAKKLSIAVLVVASVVCGTIIAMTQLRSETREHQVAKSIPFSHPAFVNLVEDDAQKCSLETGNKLLTSKVNTIIDSVTGDTVTKNCKASSVSALAEKNAKAAELQAICCGLNTALSIEAKWVHHYMTQATRMTRHFVGYGWSALWYDCQSGEHEALCAVLTDLLQGVDENTWSHNWCPAVVAPGAWQKPMAELLGAVPGTLGANGKEAPWAKKATLPLLVSMSSPEPGSYLVNMVKLLGVFGIHPQLPEGRLLAESLSTIQSSSLSESPWLPNKLSRRLLKKPTCGNGVSPDCEGAQIPLDEFGITSFAQKFIDNVVFLSALELSDGNSLKANVVDTLNAQMCMVMNMDVFLADVLLAMLNLAKMEGAEGEFRKQLNYPQLCTCFAEIDRVKKELDETGNSPDSMQPNCVTSVP